MAAYVQHHIINKQDPRDKRMKSLIALNHRGPSSYTTYRNGRPYGRRSRQQPVVLWKEVAVVGAMFILCFAVLYA